MADQADTKKAKVEADSADAEWKAFVSPPATGNTDIPPFHLAFPGSSTKQRNKKEKKRERRNEKKAVCAC